MGERENAAGEGKKSRGERRSLTALIFKAWPEDARAATLPRSALRSVREPGESRRRELRPYRAGAAAAIACLCSCTWGEDGSQRVFDDDRTKGTRVENVSQKPLTKEDMFRHASGPLSSLSERCTTLHLYDYFVTASGCGVTV